MSKKIAIVIPALNPDERLIWLLREIRALFDPFFIVVDDGSEINVRAIFDTLKTDDCAVLRHTENRGKGAALKTAFGYVAENMPHIVGCVTADADRQHHPGDIARVAAALAENPDSLVLGVRDFGEQDVPAKSRWGNRITSTVFYLQTGIKGLDTQTGLRGVPKNQIPRLAQITGERFEYEMNVLLEMAKSGVPFVRVPIQTLYIEKNRSSHFRPVRDSAHIYWEILKFSLSSVICAGIDIALFALIRLLVFRSDNAILLSTVTARLCSGICNFLFNKNVVFKEKGRSKSMWMKYGILFVLVMLASGMLTGGLAVLGMAELAAKLIADVTLFFMSFIVQKRYVFGKKRGVQT
ncbi:MAG: bifunctional glycosyltransferase family 2/GtrA family protein [Clostridium sp.]|jgi:glycosyltransferase involved in cell wall biosynthesis|nr:bifunctional glycosyltransferase family 2/GtrA family protein [Clostridium sp.]